LTLKTHILLLEPHDDVISVRDKMGWSQAGQVLLVWPERGRPLTRRLDLVLILRHSARIGAQLALVSRDPAVRSNARDLGIPVFKNPRQAQKRSWNPGRRRRWQFRPLWAEAESRPRPDLESMRQAAYPAVPAWLRSAPVRLAFFILGVLAVLAIAALLVPGAEIRLAPETRVQTLTLEAQAVPDLQPAPLSGKLPGSLPRNLPARPLVVVVEGVQEIPVSGTLELPNGFAAGEVVFSNLTDGPVRVPVGAIVSTLPSGGGSPVRFEVTRGGVVPGRSIEGAAAQRVLPVRALLPGASGNLPASGLAAIEGDLGLRLSVSNSKPTRGGTGIAAPAPSQEDYETLQAELEGKLAAQVLDKARARLSPGDLLVSTHPSQVRTVEAVFEPAEPQPSDVLKLRLRIEYEFFSVSNEDLLALGEAGLDAALPAGYTPVADSLRVETASGAEGPEAGSDAGAFALRLEAQREIRAQIPVGKAAGLALGLPPAEAEARLEETLPLAGPPSVELIPAGWPRLPVLPFRIRVVESGSLNAGD
jgi:hypothetical protein